MASRTIRVDLEVYERLAAMRWPVFGDTANDVLRRVLGLTDAGTDCEAAGCTPEEHRCQSNGLVECECGARVLAHLMATHRLFDHDREARDAGDGKVTPG